MTEVNISKKAYKQLDKVPLYIAELIISWTVSIRCRYDYFVLL